MTRTWLWVSLLTLITTCASGALADAEKPYDESRLDYFQTDSINIEFLNNSWNIPTDYFKDGKTIGQMVIDGFDAVAKGLTVTKLKVDFVEPLDELHSY